jgi:pyrroloquinoline-quinone synthase
MSASSRLDPKVREEGNKFIGELMAELDAKGLSLIQSPFIDLVVAGKATRDQLRNWATQFYIMVREAPRGIANNYVNCPDQQMRVDLAESIYEEETGRLTGTENHCALFKRFLRALGVSDEEAETTELSSKILLGGGDRRASRARPMEPEEFYDSMALGGLVGEGAMAQVAETLFQALRKPPYKFTDEELAWFEVHGEADKEHGDVLLNVVRKYAGSSTDRDRLKMKLEGAARSYQSVFSTYQG